ncbi:MAG: glycosyltransferase family 4 protein [Candidatus Gracilibacteria bacterium]
MKSIFHKTVLITRFPYEAILSGEEWHTITMAESLRTRGWRVIFMGSCPVLTIEFKKRDFEVHEVWGGTLPVTKPALIVFFLIWPVILLKLLLCFRRIDKIHSIDSIYMLSLTEKVLMTPVLKYLKKTVLWVEHQRFGKWMYLNPLRYLYTLLAKKVDVVGVSPMHVDQLKFLKIPKRQLHCITNGIDTDFFSPEGECIRVPEEAEFVIGTLARYYEDKGLDILIKAFGLLLEAHPKWNVHLVIQGEGPLEDELKALVMTGKIEKNVHFLIPYTLVPREKTPALYRGMDVCVLPSRAQDPFGLVAAEAMSTETPTIVTDVCGISVFMKNNEDAIIVPAGSVLALKEAIELLLSDEDLRKKLGKAGRKTAVEKFSLDRMVGEYEKLLEKE